jgi:hypothetical protein
VHLLLPEVMVDSKNGLLLKGPKQDPVEVQSQGKVTPERLLEMTRAPLAQPD